jgi:catechol 2,3-dioxygenase-like lactoylglutathione lyase family enzyme
MMQGTAPQLRVARPTTDLQRLLKFYCEGLGFETIGSFDDHDGFDGLMLGHPGWPYHLEFTRQRGHDAPRAPSADHLLVFYLPRRTQWLAAVERMQAAGFDPVCTSNPYWSRQGVTFEDPDGYRVVLQQGEWKP